MEGFFSLPSKKKRRQTRRPVDSPKSPCDECGLYKTCRTPRMEVTGEGRKECLIIAEAPGATEDLKGIQLIGDAGQLLRKELEKFGLDLERDFWKINAVNCRPPKNRKPTRREIKLCRFMVQSAIDQYKPKYIWLLGNSAVESLYLGEFSRLGITRWRKFCIPDFDVGSWVIPLYHPSYILRNEYDENLVSLYRRDLKWAVSCFGKRFPERENFQTKVRILVDSSLVLEKLENILDDVEYIAFDYETTGLKPYDKGHKIWTLSVATSEEEAFAFPISYPLGAPNSYPQWDTVEAKEILYLWKEILREKRIRKIAHNMKFEDAWSRNIFGVDVKGWHWCTMIGSHIIDNRKDITGLKFQSFVHFGIKGYDREVRKYISVDPKTGLNRLDEFPLDKLLLYNGLDSLLTYRLYEYQRKYFLRRNGLENARLFFLSGLKSLSKVQDVGINADLDYYVKENSELIGEKERLLSDLLSSKEGKLYKSKVGKEFDPLSPTQLKKLVYDFLGFKPSKFTEKGNPSVDKGVLEKLKGDFFKKILRYRKIEKIQGTYLAQFLREVSEDGRIHPFFDLHTARTYRSSSSQPNFQNIPVRDKEAKKVTRMGLIPSPGNYICEVDYSSLEVRIAACYTKDASLVKYVNDPSTDMHRDTACDLWKLEKSEVSKDIRFYAKNGWVFPQFYGDWYKSCAQSLWVNCLGLKTNSGIPLKDHARNIGWRKYDDFENHCKWVEDQFWNVRFKDYKQWKHDINAFYRRRGYVETFLGFRFVGYLSYKDTTNYPIQGTAFHCLLWSLIRILDFIESRNLKSRIVGQIHDSIVFDVYPPETDILLPKVKEIMENEIRDEFDWIIVPMEVEFEVTEIDQPWYYKKEIKV